MPVGYGLYDEATFKDPGMRPRIDRIVGEVVRHGRIMVADKVPKDSEMDGSFARREKIKSAAGFPLIHSGKVLGALFVSYRSAGQSFSKNTQQRIKPYVQKVARMIAESNLWKTLRQSQSHSKSEEEQTLQAIVMMACSLINQPIAIWLLDRHSQELNIRAATGMTHRYVNDASVQIGDGSIISQIVETGEEQAIPDISDDSRFHFTEYARKAGWIGMLGFPVKLRGITAGVIEVFTFEPREFKNAQARRNSFRRLTNMASVTIENAHRSNEAQKLAWVAQTLSSTPGDFDKAMQVVVECARELTGADSSTINLFEKRTNSFVVGSRTGKPEESPESIPRSDGGLTRRVTDSGNAVKIDDTTRDSRVRKQIVSEGIRSLIGVRLQMEEERIGVLYVNGLRKNQFVDADVKVLQTLANQASVALGWTRLLLKPSEEIETAASEIFRLENILDETCHEVKDSDADKYDLVTIQLVRPEENIIESVHAIGLAKDWPGRFKHPLLQNPELRDIHADLVLENPPHIEIIKGWDRRFNRWIYDTYHHENYVRVYAPIIIVRDNSGKLIDDWVDQCDWMIDTENKRIFDEKEQREGELTVVRIYIPNIDDKNREWEYEIIGTIEAGFQDHEKSITPDQAIRLTKFMARKAHNIHRALLPHVLEVVVERAMGIVRADSASIHYLYEPSQNRYIYQVCTGYLGRRMLKDMPPRVNGLGRQAIQDKKTKFLPDASQGHNDLNLEKFNPKVHAQGIKAMAAFPLLIGRKQGVLYVSFQRDHRFTEAEIGWIQLFANRAIDAIRHATTYTKMRDRTRQLSVLHSIAQSLASTLNEIDLLEYISWNILNVLAADVVTIYEYLEDRRDDTQKQILTPPNIAGRLLAEINMTSAVDQTAAPTSLVEHRVNIYAEKSVEDKILNNPELSQPTDQSVSFVTREKIESSAGILLKVGLEVVGILFINYRRPHNFLDYEKNIIDTLASSAAIAIKNKRLLQALSAGDREIITTLDLEDVLSLIVKRAVRVTGADVGELRQLDIFNQELVVQSRYPTGVSVDPTRARIKIGEGITGKVAAHRRSAIIDDVQADPRYQAYFADIRSALCVPLLDKGLQILGVLTVGSWKEGSFNKRNQWILEILANQAVIAIQNAKNQKQLIAAETMATLGDLAGSLMHRMNNDIGAIRTLAQELLDRDHDHRTEKTNEIRLLAGKFLDEVQGLRRWILEIPQPIHPNHIIDKAADRVGIPSNISLISNLSDYLPSVSAGEQQLTEVLMNLIQNAVNAMPVGGSLSIGSRTAELEGKKMIVMWVHDTGIGIASENFEAIFQRNYTSNKSVKRALGFGLWWSRAYIQRLGGELTVTSELSKWTQFTVTLPVHS